MYDVIKDALVMLIQLLMAALIPLLARYIIAYIERKKSQVTSQIQNDAVRLCLDELAEAVSSAVSHTSQTYVDELKKNGRFGSEECQRALEQAKQTALATLAPETKTLLQARYGDLKRLIEAKIEDSVRIQRNG